jgi:hypothetical protein
MVIFILVIRAEWVALYKQPGVAAQYRKCSPQHFVFSAHQTKVNLTYL